MDLPVIQETGNWFMLKISLQKNWPPRENGLLKNGKAGKKSKPLLAQLVLSTPTVSRRGPRFEPVCSHRITPEESGVIFFMFKTYILFSKSKNTKGYSAGRFVHWKSRKKIEPVINSPGLEYSDLLSENPCASTK